MSNDWTAATDWETVCRRNAGRRAYNARRSFCRAHRRMLVAQLLCRYGMLTHGAYARIARELGVSKATITRDVQALIALQCPCPCCGCLVPRERIEGRRG